jgi:hypothetical protein
MTALTTSDVLAPPQFDAWMCKQARRELHWGFAQLAHHSNCSIKVVREFESRGDVPEADRIAIYAALRKGGLDRLRNFAGILNCEYPVLSNGPGSALPPSSAA